MHWNEMAALPAIHSVAIFGAKARREIAIEQSIGKKL
jgi:hypothetical protein